MLTNVQIIDQAQSLSLYLFFLSINLEMWDPFNTDGYFSLSKLTGLIYLLSITPQVKRFIRRNAIQPFLGPLLLYFVLLTIVSLFNINDVSANFLNSSLLFNILLLWFLVNHERKHKFILEKGMVSFAFGSVLTALLFQMDIGVEYDQGRAMIFGDNQNVIAIKLCISIIILVMNVIEDRLSLKRLRFVLLVPCPFLLQFMIETASRTAFISLTISLMIGTILFKSMRLRSKILIVIIGVSTLIGVWVYMMRSEMLLQRLFLSTGDYGVTGRTDIWFEIFPIIESSPIWGVGETGYAYFCESIFGKMISPHNVILELLCYTGFIGLYIYGIFLYRISRGGYDIYSIQGILLPLLLLVPVFGVILTGQILTSKIVWIIFAYIIGNSTLRSKLPYSNNPLLRHSQQDIQCRPL